MDPVAQLPSSHILIRFFGLGFWNPKPSTLNSKPQTLNRVVIGFFGLGFLVKGLGSRARVWVSP